MYVCVREREKTKETRKKERAREYTDKHSNVYIDLHRCVYGTSVCTYAHGVYAFGYTYIYVYTPEC